MSKTLVRGLELIEELGLYGPMTISDLLRAAIQPDAQDIFDVAARAPGNDAKGG